MTGNATSAVPQHENSCAVALEDALSQATPPGLKVQSSSVMDLPFDKEVKAWCFFLLLAMVHPQEEPKPPLGPRVQLVRA